MDSRVDVLIVGAGPAGAALACALSPGRSVAMVAHRLSPSMALGESIPPVAMAMLADLGLADAFPHSEHEPCFRNVSVWGSNEISSVEALQNPRGAGWHLDRERFDEWLREAACRSGCRLLRPARLCGIAHEDGRWRVKLAQAFGEIDVEADVVVDATGRAALVGRRLGVPRMATDRLVAHYMFGTSDAGEFSGATFVQAEARGWWYTAPIPGGRRVLAFYTDADLLPPDRTARALLSRALGEAHIGHVLRESRFHGEDEARVAAAHDSFLQAVAGKGWLAIGDAAFSADPVSSQGISNSLFTALLAAQAIEQGFAAEAQVSYSNAVGHARETYLGHRARIYGMEQRWKSAPFWSRRRLSLN